MVKEERKKCAVYSGSFNPFHKGHCMIVDELSKKFDQVRVVVTPHNPLKENVSKESFKMRVCEVILDVSLLPLADKIVVDDIEGGMPEPNYYINTLKRIEELHPEYDIVPVFGGDCLESFDKWYQWKDIFKGREVCIVPRKGYDAEAYLERLKSLSPRSSKKWNVTFLDFDIPKISSTEIRENESLA